MQQQMAHRNVWVDTDVVLDNGIGEPLAPWTVAADFRRITKELELPHTRFHDLRHAHATRLFEAGVGPKAVSERLAHSSTRFTMDTYSAVIPSLGRAAADAIEDGLGQPVSGPKVDPGFDRIRMRGGVFAGRWVHPTGQYSKKYAR
jgi:integrase